MRVAIHQNEDVYAHSGSWADEWASYCSANDIEHNAIDFFGAGSPGMLRHYDIALWHFGNYSLQEMLFARSILNAAEHGGTQVFPNSQTSWHFDDKVAQSYLLEAANAQIPKWWHFVTEDACIRWIEEEAHFPIVAKLRNGSGSMNVRLLGDAATAKRFTRTMFGRGRDPSPRIGFKVVSNARSARDLTALRNRLARAPEFFRTRARAREFPRERGYVYFQEFVPNSGLDFKVVVIDEKLSFIGRRVRKGDFRASGGGDLTFDRSHIVSSIIESAFQTSEVLGFQCMGYDFVVDTETEIPKIIEISYGFSHAALLEAGGYFDRSGQWYPEPLNAPHAILESLLRVRH